MGCNCVIPDLKSSDQSHVNERLDSIERAIAESDEVIAWKAALEALADFRTGSGIETELRLRTEQDQDDHDQRVEGALRWRLDGDRPRWFVANEREGNLRIYENELEIVEHELRSRIKRKLLKLSYLRVKQNLLNGEKDIWQAELSMSEDLLKSGEADVFLNSRKRRKAASANEAVFNAQDEIARLERELRIEYGIELPDTGKDLPATWRLKDSPDELRSIGLDSRNPSIDTLLQRHPVSMIFEGELEFAKDRLLRQKKKGKLNLSYVQLQYEEHRDAGEDSGESIVGLGVGVNLPFWNKASLRREEAGKAHTNAELVGRLVRTRSKIAAAIEGWMLASQRRSRYEEELLKHKAELRELEIFMAENATQGSLLDLQKEQLEVQTSLLELRMENFEAAIDLEESCCIEFMYRTML